MLRITQQPCRLTPRMSCGEKWRGLCSVESARGLPPEPLTEPYVILSHHTALVIEPWRQEYRRHQWLSLARWILSHRDCRSAQGPMTWPLRSTAITAASSLLRTTPPLRLASVLSALMVLSTLAGSLNIEATGSHVPYSSPSYRHAAYTPDAARPVVRRLPCSSRAFAEATVSTSSIRFRCLISGSLSFVSVQLT
jgi:hypothetical protein